MRWLVARSDTPLPELWMECPRGDWLMWAASRLFHKDKRLALAACECAETVLRTLPDDVRQPWDDTALVVELAKRYVHGEVDEKELAEAAQPLILAYETASKRHATHCVVVAAVRSAQGKLIWDHETVRMADMADGGTRSLERAQIVRSHFLWHEVEEMLKKAKSPEEEDE
jgi:hypothetical protein